MLAHVADEVKEKVVLHPVVVVANLGTVDRVVEVEEATELLADALHIMLNFLNGEEFSFLGFEGGVANHAGGATHNGQGLVACQLEVFQQHDGDEVSDMERVGRRVNTYVSRSDFLFELLFGARHDVMNHTAPFEFFY